MENILLITHGTGGDVIPFIELGRILKNVGYNVVIFTHCIYEKEVKENGLDFVAIDSYEEYQERCDDLYKLSDSINRLDEYLEFNIKYHGADRTYKEYKILSEYCKTGNNVILFRHRSSLAGLLAAEEYGCSVASVFLAPNYISHLELHEQLIGDSMKKEMNKVRIKIGLSNISSWTDWMCSTNLKLALWPKWYAKDETESIDGMIPIGFPKMKDENTCEIPKEINEFLNNSKKTALITAGTSNVISPNFYKIAAEACIGANINGILVTAIEEFVPKNLPSSILRVKEAPIKTIMPHVDVVIHHGGIGTSSEALVCGTPQLIMPHLIDRPDNADRLKKAGVAKVFSEISWKIHSIEKALKEIIYDEVLSIGCRSLAEKNDDYDIEEKLKLIIKELLGNKEKFKINSLYKANKTILSNDDKESIPSKNEVFVDSIAEKKKEMLLKLLREKRKI